MIFDLFSKRQKRLRGETFDVFTYDKLPQQLKVQIVYIIKEAIGTDVGYGYSGSNQVDQIYKFLHNSISREYGQFSLGQYNETDEDAILNFFLRTSETEKAIDIIELTFKYIDTVIRKNLLQYHYRER